MQPTFDSFASHLRGQDRAERTVQGYLDDLRAFARWYEQTNGETLRPEALTPSDVREYRQWLMSRDAAPASVNRRLAALRAFVQRSRGETLDVRGV